MIGLLTGIALSSEGSTIIRRLDYLEYKSAVEDRDAHIKQLKRSIVEQNRTILNTGKRRLPLWGRHR